MRNRLIAPLTRGTVVVEAAARSGAQATAKRANRLGRQVQGRARSGHVGDERGLSPATIAGCDVLDVLKRTSRRGGLTGRAATRTVPG